MGRVSCLADYRAQVARLCVVEATPIVDRDVDSRSNQAAARTGSRPLLGGGTAREKSLFGAAVADVVLPGGDGAGSQ